MAVLEWHLCCWASLPIDWCQLTRCFVISANKTVSRLSVLARSAVWLIGPLFSLRLPLIVACSLRKGHWHCHYVMTSLYNASDATHIVLQFLISQSLLWEWDVEEVSSSSCLQLQLEWWWDVTMSADYGSIWMGECLEKSISNVYCVSGMGWCSYYRSLVCNGIIVEPH